MTTIISAIYASAPAGEVLIPTIEIRHASMPSVHLTIGFDNVTATLETSASGTPLTPADSL